MDVTVSWWAVAVVLSLAACGFLAVCWVVSGWAEQAADWWRRDRVAPLLEDEPDYCECCEALGFDPHAGLEDGYCRGCAHWHGERLELPPPLPPERTWEQMTSHQLPFSETDLWPDDFGGLIRGRHLEAARERRAPWWESFHRAQYAALDLEYPSVLLARVRELTP